MRQRGSGTTRIALLIEPCHSTRVSGAISPRRLGHSTAVSTSSSTSISVGRSTLTVIPPLFLAGSISPPPRLGTRSLARLAVSVLLAGMTRRRWMASTNPKGVLFSAKTYMFPIGSFNVTTSGDNSAPSG
jgi:hypothetical protein